MSLLVGRGGAQLAVKNSVVRDTKLSAGASGHGAVADADGALTLDGAWFLGHPGIAVVVSAASATLTHSLIARSTIAIHVQRGTNLVTGDAPPTVPGTLACFVANDTRFVDNQTRIGSGFVPLPEPLGDTPSTPVKPP